MLKNVPGIALCRRGAEEMVRLETATKMDEEELPKIEVSGCVWEEELPKTEVSGCVWVEMWHTIVSVKIRQSRSCVFNFHNEILE